MPITHEIDRERDLLLVRRSGTIETQDEQAALVARRRDPGVKPGIRVLVDSREVVPPDSPEVIRYVAEHVAQAASKLRCGAVALVVGSDVQYGMARMYQTLTESSHPHTRVFRDMVEGLAWLMSQASGGGDREG